MPGLGKVLAAEPGGQVNHDFGGRCFDYGYLYLRFYLPDKN
jgi:hypothetical protein